MFPEPFTRQRFPGARRRRPDVGARLAGLNLFIYFPIITAEIAVRNARGLRVACRVRHGATNGRVIVRRVMRSSIHFLYVFFFIERKYTRHKEKKTLRFSLRKDGKREKKRHLRERRVYIIYTRRSRSFRQKVRKLDVGLDMDLFIGIARIHIHNYGLIRIHRTRIYVCVRLHRMENATCVCERAIICT